MASKAKSDEARLDRALAKFVQPVEPDNPLAHPIAAFEWEYRRTIARIMWYDEEIAKLDVDALTWGKSKTEEIGASEFAGKNVTWEARANTLHELQYRERRHLLDLTKVWIGAHLDERKLDIQRAYVRALDAAIVGILTRLGADVADPAVRQIVREELVAIGPAGA